MTFLKELKLSLGDRANMIHKLYSLICTEDCDRYIIVKALDN